MQENSLSRGNEREESKVKHRDADAAAKEAQKRKRALLEAQRAHGDRKLAIIRSVVEELLGPEMAVAVERFLRLRVLSSRGSP